VTFKITMPNRINVLSKEDKITIERPFSEQRKEVVVERPFKEKDLLFLDALRGITAAIVMIGHARWLLWEGYSEGYLKHPGDYSSMEKAVMYFFSIFRFGHEAVLFFFVLSGFVIHLKYAKKLAKSDAGNFDVRQYIYRRVKRIYPPFLFVLLLTFLLDKIGMYFDYSIYRNSTPNALLNANISLDHSWGNLIGNLFFWEGSGVKIWGTNSPLWSLKFEWWFYLLYPLLFFFNKKSVLYSNLIVLFAFAVSFLLPFPEVVSFFKSVLHYLLFWWLGAVLADIYTRRIGIDHLFCSILALLIPVMAVFGKKITDNILADGLWALGFFGMLNFFFWLQARGVNLSFSRKIKWLGDCSYTLYIIHFPILVICNGLLLKTTGNKMPTSQIYLLIFIPFILLVSYGVHLLVEKPFVSKRSV
jgi:peptidoglycan/LPS O-acetylase OafA/YrhL